MQKSEEFPAVFDAVGLADAGLAGLWVLAGRPALAEEPPVPAGPAEEEAARGQPCPSALLRRELSQPFPLLLPPWCWPWPPSTSSCLRRAVGSPRGPAAGSSWGGRPCLRRPLPAPALLLPSTIPPQPWGESVRSSLPQSRGLACFLSCENKAAKHTKDSSPHDSREKLGKKGPWCFHQKGRESLNIFISFGAFFNLVIFFFLNQISLFFFFPLCAV